MAARKKNHAFPLLSAEKADNIVRELGGALDSHRVWFEEFQSMLVCRSKPGKSDLDRKAHKNTAFGRWYSGKVNHLLLDHPDFKSVGKHNKRMHNLARKLALAVRDGDDISKAQYGAFQASAAHFRVSVRKLLSEAWNHLRYTDSLTGVMTRAIMESRLEEEQERLRRSGQTSCIGIMDLDHFKKVNDVFGHQAGDKTLRAIAQFMTGNLRRYDQLFRYGGEEFLMLLPNSTPLNAKGVLDRLRRGIKRQNIKVGKNKALNVSASFGVAEMLANSPVKGVIECADQALYEAKRTGRNRVCVWPVIKTASRRSKNG